MPLPSLQLQRAWKHRATMKTARQWQAMPVPQHMFCLLKQKTRQRVLQHSLRWKNRLWLLRLCPGLQCANRNPTRLSDTQRACNTARTHFL